LIESKAECKPPRPINSTVGFLRLNGIMKRIPIGIVFLLLAMSVNISPRAKAQLTTSLGGKVFRSDTNMPINNSYILLMQERQNRAEAEHFDIRTGTDGKYRFTNIPAGKYTVSIYSWYRNRLDVPCTDSIDAKTADEGHVTIEWQRKSDAFMEIVTIKGFSIETDRDTERNFDVACRQRAKLLDAETKPNKIVAAERGERVLHLDWWIRRCM